MAESREVAKRWLEAFNAHDEQAIRELTAADATLNAPPDLTVEGEPAVTAYAMAWANAFPDARIHIHHETVSGNTVVQEFTFDGTHQATLSGPGGDIPATNKHLSGRGIQVMEVEGDKVKAFRLYFDQVQVLTQLGVMRADAMSS